MSHTKPRGQLLPAMIVTIMLRDSFLLLVVIVRLHKSYAQAQDLFAHCI